MAVALRGNLSDFGIGEVFQLIGQQRKTGVLEVDGGRRNASTCRFVEGSVVSAATAGPHEDAALGDMLVRAGLLARATAWWRSRAASTAEELPPPG